MGKSDKVNKRDPINKRVEKLNKKFSRLLDGMNLSAEELDIFETDIEELKQLWGELIDGITTTVDDDPTVPDYVFNLNIINCNGYEVDCGTYTISSFIKKIESDDTDAPSLDDTVVDCYIPELLYIPRCEDHPESVNSLYLYLKSLKIDGVNTAQNS